MAELFEARDWSGATLRRIDLTGAALTDVRLTDATIERAELSGVRLRDIESRELRIDGEVERLLVHGVDVMPLLWAELDRLHPERALLRPTDADGFRIAWVTIEAMWTPTVERARGLDPDLLHRSVGGEWSFIETLRHLVFATESWLHRVVLGDPTPWHPLSLPWDGMPDVPEIPRDRAVRPTLDEVMAVRTDRMAAVRRFVDGLTDERLSGATDPVDGPGFPRPRPYPLAEALGIIVNEEWWHHRFAVRDLDALTHDA
jgi:uncharacterized damage-inducible protein DinB